MQVNLIAIFRFIFILLLSTFSFSHWLFGQSLPWQRLGNESGLLSEEVYGLLQDQSGRIWAFTELGAQRHNGHRFEIMPEIPSRFSVVYAACNQPDTSLFMFNSAGKSVIFKNEKWELHPLSDQIEDQSLQKNDLIYNVKIGNKGSLLLQSAFNVLSANSSQKTLIPHRSTNLISNLEIQVVEKEGSFLVYSPKRAPDSKAKGDKSYLIRFGNDLGVGNTIKIDPKFGQNRRFFASKTESGIVLSAFEFLILKSANNQLISRKLPSEIMNLKKGPDGRFWVATRHNGLYFFDTNLKKTDSTLAGKAIGDLLFDRMGGIWASTLNEGIFYLPDMSVRIFNPIKPSPDNNLHLNSFGNKLILGFNNSILIKEEGSLKSINLPVSPNFVQTDLLPYKKGYYIASKQGLLRFDSAFHLPNKILSATTENRVYARELCLHKGNIYLTGRKGLSRIVNGKVEELVVTTGFSYGLRSFEGFLCMATSDGLQVYSEKGQGLQLVYTLFDGLEITKIKVDSHGLWAVLPGKGIFIVDKKFKARKMPGLERFSGIRDFVLTQDSQMFVAGGSGLLKGKLMKNLKFRSERHFYTQTVNQVVQFKNEIWFSSRSGVLFFPLSQNSGNQNFPLLLNKIKVNGNQIKSRLPASFKAGENSLTFQFDLLNYFTPQSRLSFRLSGHESQEGLISGNEIAFQNLNPGIYQLSVTGEGFFGERLSETVQLNFEIKPAYWQTWWFKLAALLVLIFLITAAIWYIFKTYRIRDQEKNRINQLLASYKLRALQSQMNPHFVSNALTAIQQLILTKEHLKANQYLTKFSRLLRLVLSFSEKPFIPLSGEINLIKLNVDLEGLRFGNRFSFLLEVSENIDVENLLIPSLITQPFIENAIWHGLIPLEQSQIAILKMNIQIENDQLKIRISDNGIGRKASGAKKTIGHDSIGLKLTMDRLQNLNRLMKGTLATIEVKDLFENEKACGTLVCISLPLNLNLYAIEGLSY